MLYQTHVRVHLDRIAANLAGIRSAVGPDRRVLMAVKADAYGHGAVAVARAALEGGAVDAFGVATVPEGIELREAGIDAPILKFSPAFPEEMDAALAARVTLTVASRQGADELQAAAARSGRPAAAHLKVDTGMRRIGVEPERAGELAAHLAARCPDVDVRGVFTHFPVSDVPAGREFTQGQVARLAAAVDDIQHALGRPVADVHAANSGAVLGHEEAWLTMVRPGIMCYGYYPDAATPRTIELAPALDWVTRVSFVKRVAAGESVGYGRTWTAPRDTWIGTLPVGYADGYDRHLSNRGKVIIADVEYPVAGRVCMDQTMIDLGPETEVRVGDEAFLLRCDDAAYTAADMADDLGTISYEVTCGIGRRVPRHYRGRA